MVIITKRNAIMVLLGIELMLNASNLNLVAFNQLHPAHLSGQMFALFVIIVAVCEAAVGLAIVLRVYQHYQTSVPDEVTDLKD
jgi:NADH:ubiquinone oxidoreductase subunit K